MFSNSTKCRPPHVNSDNMRESLFTSEILKKHNTEKKLLDFLRKRNNEIEKRVTKAVELDGGKDISCSKTGLEKAIRNKFFLRVESSWLYV